MALSAISALVAWAWLLRLHNRLKMVCENQAAVIRGLEERNVARCLALAMKAKVEERYSPHPHFAIYREGAGKKFDVLYIDFDRNDPDDREYKRIHATEVADMLNYKP